MPRSSRHKSSKHSSREAKEYSDSEKESNLKDRKGKEESGGGARVSKESEKRKVDSAKDAKDLYASGNGDYSEEHGSSKRRRERTGDGVSDRWNGGEEDRTEVSKKSKESKASGDLKSGSSSKRREEGVGMFVEGEEGKKSSGKHRDSGRKEGKEGGVEREKKSKEGKSERSVIDNDEQRETKKAVENTDLNAQDGLRSPEPENQLERRTRKRRDGSGDLEKHQDDIGDVNDRRLLSRDDICKDGRQKDEKRKDERSKDKYREEIDRDNKHRDDKQSDERLAKDHTSIRSDDKRARDDKDSTEIRQRRTKAQDSDRNRERDRDSERYRDRERDRDLEVSRDRDRCHDRDRERDGDRGHDRSRDPDRDNDRDRERDWDWDRDRDRDHDRGRDRFRERERGRDNDREYDRDREYERDRDRDLERDHDGSQLDDRSARYKDSRGKKRSPDDRDDSIDNKTRVVKAHYPDVEKKSLSGGKVESDADRGRSQSRQAHLDTPTSSNRRRTSPSSSSHVGMDEYRHLNPDDLKYRDKSDPRSKAISSREVSVLSGVTEKGAKYRSMEKPVKIDDGHLGELSTERSSSSKASPRGLVERSPSSTSIDRRYMNRTGVRRSLDIEETGRRNSVTIDARDFSTTEDRLYRDFPQEKPLLDESSQADSAYYNRTSQSIASSLIPPPAFRAGVDSPTLAGSLEEDGRHNSTPRYKRGSDAGLGRGHGNSWRGVPNWNSSVPNGFIPFQHGPPHGGFQAMMPQFPSQPLFGVRPAMEMNHSGIHYHIPEADRFASHLRPVGWQNMMDGSGPPHLHGWDGSNGSGPPHMYGGPEWEQKRHSMNGRGWESNADLWKGQDGDMKRDLPSPSLKDDYPEQAPADDVLAMKAGQRSHNEENHHEVQAKTADISSTGTSPAKETSDSLPKPAHEEAADHTTLSSDDVSYFSRFYLSKLDISAELAHPELYNQCISLLDIKESTTMDEDPTMDVLLEDGGRASLKYSNSLSSHSLFPAMKDSVFQRAMDLYKKQRVDIVGLLSVAGRTLDIISASNQVMEEQAPICNVEKAEEPIPTLNAEMPSSPMSTVDQKNVEAIALMPENMEEPISTPTQEAQNHVCTPTEEVLVAYGGENPGEPLPASSGEKDGMASEQVNSEVADGECLMPVDNELQATTTFSTDGDNINGLGKTNGNNSSYYAEERLSDDAIIGPKFFPGGSPRACEALMPGSNESESVILSRIHHSPESTH